MLRLTERAQRALGEAMKKSGQDLVLKVESAGMS